MSNPRELPILFNAAMVRALLSGTKSQTRRPIPKKVMADMKIAQQIGEVSDFYDSGYLQKNDESYIVDFAQHQIGDRLYVRERAKALIVSSDYIFGGQGKAIFRYEADRSQSGWVVIPKRLKPIKQGNCLSNGCFKEAARIWLEVVDVRVERVQDIDEVGAMAEGIPHQPADIGDPHGTYYQQQFKYLWDSIYMNWHKNPWVFVYKFKVVK